MSEPTSDAETPMTVSEQQDAEIASHPERQRMNNGLSEDERAELERFRAQKAKDEAAKLEPDEPEPYLWLHLADGRVIESTGHMTHYKGVPVVAAYPIVEEEETS